MLKLWCVFDGEESSWWSAATAEDAKAAHKSCVSDPGDDAAFTVEEWQPADAGSEDLLVAVDVGRDDGRTRVPLTDLFAEANAHRKPDDLEPTLLAATVE